MASTKDFSIKPAPPSAPILVLSAGHGLPNKQSSGSVSIVQWRPLPLNSSKPFGVRVHLFNTWDTARSLSLTQIQIPVLLESISDYHSKLRAEEQLWNETTVALKSRPLMPINIQSKFPLWFDVNVNDDIRAKIETGKYGAGIAVIGRDSAGRIALEGCIFITDRPDAVLLCNDHNKPATNLKN